MKLDTIYVCLLPTTSCYVQIAKHETEFRYVLLQAWTTTDLTSALKLLQKHWC
jgi:hypothetical protein